MKKQRKFLPTLGELIDRLSIHQLKEVFIPENKKNYAKEMNDMVHDIDMILKEHKGEKGSDNLMLTHGLNGIRNTAINKIMEVIGGRKDYKVDCIASEFKDWDVSW